MLNNKYIILRGYSQFNTVRIDNKRINFIYLYLISYLFKYEYLGIYYFTITKKNNSNYLIFFNRYHMIHVFFLFN